MGQKVVQKQKRAINEKRVRSHPELTSTRILIAEDDEDTALTYKMALKDAGYEVKIVDNGEECAKIYLEKFQEFRFLKSKKTAVHPYDQPFEVVILDYRMPRMDGLQVAKEILTENYFRIRLCQGNIERFCKGAQASCRVIAKTLFIADLGRYNQR